MELDDLKQALTALDRRFDEQVAVQERALRLLATSRITRSLRPLALGQIAQAAAGILSILLGVTAWQTDMDNLGGQFFSGLAVHLYGVAMVALAVLTHVAIARIEDDGPLVATQRRLAELQSLNIRAGYFLGMSWWVLWVPFLIVTFWAAFGADLYSLNPAFAQLAVFVGLIGLLACASLHRWAARTGRERLAALFDHALMGASLRKAQMRLAEIASFERD